MQTPTTGRRFWAGLLVGICAGLAVSSVLAGVERPDAERLIDEFFRPLAWLVGEVDERYVDQVDYGEMMEGAYHGILSKLDRYCAYFPPEAYQEFREETTGEFGGLGIEITFDRAKKAVRVERPIPGTPAFEAGLIGGDLIVEVLEESTGELTRTADFGGVHDALAVLRGEVGAEVTITVVRADTGKRERVTIRRGVIEIPGVRGAEIVDAQPQIGYIYMAEFHERLLDDLQGKIDDLRAQGMKALVLDMRFNTGGLLQSSLAVADLFLEDDRVIVKTRGRDGGDESFRSRRDETYPDLKLALLVNRGSASAAEIVAAALQEHGRALVVGEPTFGKASVQTILEYPTGEGAIKLTTARYYTPNDNLIEGDGVHPDIEVALSDEETRALIGYLGQKTRIRPTEGEDAAAPPAQPEGEQEETPFEDRQMARAVQELTALLAREEAPPTPAPATAQSTPEPAAG